MVAFDAVGPSAAGAGSGATPLTWTHVNSGNGIFVGITTLTGSSNTVTSVTYGGVTVPLRGFIESGGVGHGSGGIALYGLIGPTCPTGSNTVSVAFSDGSNHNAGSISVSAAGALGTVFTATQSTSTGTGSVTVNGTTTGGLIVSAAAFGGGSSTGTFGATAPNVLRWSHDGTTNTASDNGCGGTAPSTGGGANQTVTFTNTNTDNWGLIAVEVLPGGGPLPQVQQAGRRSKSLRQHRYRQQPVFAPRPDVPQVTTANAGLAAAAAIAPPLAFGRYITGLAGTGAGYFADNQGAPRMWLGDEIWAMLTNAGRWNSGNYQATFDAYFASRAAQGFTICYSDMFNSTFIGGAVNGQMWNGQTPFTSNNPSSGLNSTYWTVIDYALNSAKTNGITIALSFGGHWDWDVSGNAMFGFTGTQYQAAGNAIGTRYKNQPNLIWLIMDDYFGSFDSSLSSLLTGLRASGDTHPIAIENFSESSSRYIYLNTDTGCGTTNGSATVTDSNSSTQYVGAGVAGSGIPAGSVIISANPGVSFVMNNQATATASVTLSISNIQASWGTANTQYNFGYSYACTYLCIEAMYAEPSLPGGLSALTAFYGDGYFYQGGSTYDASLDRAIRQDAWWALASGARGFNVGDEALWQWPSSAPAAVSTQWYGANNTANIRAYVESLPGWHTLAPATGSVLITAGRGTRATQIVSGGGGTQYEPAFTNAYVAASRTPDTGSGSSLAVLYLPVATTITIDQTKLASGYTATWVDPVTCATSAATAGATYNSTAKGNNSRGAPDWVLVLQAPAGTSANAGLATAAAAAPGVPVGTAIGVSAGLAAATAAAPAPVVAIGAKPGLGTGIAAAPGVPVGTAIGVTPGLGTATAAAPGVPVGTAIGVSPGLSTTAAAAAAPSVSTATAVSAPAGFASAAAAAPVASTIPFTTAPSGGSAAADLGNGSGSWVNPANALADDGALATWTAP
jgi:hypothetical protein